MNILRLNRKSKNKIKPKTLLLLIFSLIMTTFAWFAYSKVLEPTLNIHMASWDITYEIDGVEKKNPVEVEFDVLYPTMPTQTVVIDIFNNGETLVDIEHQVKSLKIAGNEYQIVYEGGTIPSENYIVVTPSVLTTVEKTVETEDEATGQITTTTVTEQVYKGVVTNDITRFPFTIEIEHSSQVLPVTEDEYGTTIPGQGYLKVTVNWVGDHNDLDSEWGFIVGDYLANNPGESAMSVELSIDSYQANPNAEDEVVETIMPSTSTTRPYLPDGFTRIPGTSLATGLAITDDSGNEYVWVEVPRATSVYQNAGIKITEFSSDDANGAYSKIEADLRAYVGDYSDRADAYTSSDALGFNPTNYTALKQKMLKSIYNHGGFYIGRYEAGVESGIRTKASDALVPAVIKSNAYPYNYVTSSQAHSLATALAPTGYTSGLMFGLQWDLVMKYLETKSAQFVSTDEKAAAIADMQYKLKSDSTSWGNFTNNSYSLTNANVQYMKEADLAAGWLTTWREETVEGETVLIASPYEKDEGETVLITSGGNSSFCNQNIYDIAGNLSEWTYNVVYADGAYRGGNGGNYTLNGGAGEDDALAIAGAGAGETSNFATANSYGSYNVMAGAKEVGFRVALLSDSDVTEPWGDNDCPITKISLDKTSDETEVGKSLTITATTNAGAVGDIIWESSDESIATVIGSGTNLTTATVTGVAKGGPITITARNEEGTAVATCEVTVRQYITGITLNPTTADVKIGETFSITATIDEGAEDDIIWESSNTDIATVIGSGTNNTTATVTGVAKGTATITAKNADGTVSASCAVTVHQYITQITLNPTSAEVDEGKTFKITATINAGAEDNIIWVSSNTSVATVTGSGTNKTTATVTGVAKGTATITAKNSAGTVSATCSVQVTQPEPYLPTGFSWANTGHTEIKDASNNQYVWVEVPKSVYGNTTYNTETTRGDRKPSSSTDYDDIEYCLKQYTATYAESDYEDTYVAGKGIASESAYNTLKQKMLKSIYENGGFYVGKYEAGTRTARTSESDALTTAVVQADAYPYNYVTNAQAQELANGMESGDRTSSLLFGLQWSLMLKHFETKGTAVADLISDSTEWGNYYDNTFTTTSSSKYTTDYGASWKKGPYNQTSSGYVFLTTGACSEFEKEGLYDVAGNVWEWTLESDPRSESMPLIYRGGTTNPYGNHFPACCRWYAYISDSYPNIGFRVAIY